MAERQKISDVRGTAVNLNNAILQVNTKHDGYYGIPKGSHEYIVLEDTNGYSVHPIRPTIVDGEVTFDTAVEGVVIEDPIIRVIGEDVYYISNTRIDPYDGIYAVNVDSNDPVSDRVLDAFEAFIQNEFRFGSYYTYYLGEAGFEDGVAPVEVP